jgi:hypothetical protein
VGKGDAYYLLGCHSHITSLTLAHIHHSTKINMNHEIWLWVATAVYGVHILEEFVLDWKNWANNVMKLPVDWPAFYVTNALVIVLGIVAAEVGWRLPALSLAYPALMVINAIFFHVLPFVITKKYSPGLFSAVLLFLPIGIWLFYGAEKDGVLSVTTTVSAFVLGAGLMAYPVILLKLKDKPFFKQG